MAIEWTTTTFNIPLDAGDEDAYPNKNAILDVDGDGDLDLIAGHILYPLEDRGVPIVIMLNDGNGGFTDGTSLFFPGGAPTMVHPSDIVIADFNGDGRPDLFITDSGLDAAPSPGAQNRLLLSTGAKGFKDASDRLPQVLDSSHSAAAGDVNGDGHIDLLVMNISGGTPFHGPATNPYFLINDGTGRFTQTFGLLPDDIENRINGHKSTTVELFDADGDGDLDLLLGSHAETEDNFSDILFNDGSGDFSASPMTQLPPGPFEWPGLVVDADVVDLNGDGALDLVLTLTDDYQDHYIQILINDGSGQFADESAARLPQDSQPGTWSTGTHVVDLNGDGHMDLVRQHVLGQSFFLNDGTGHFIPLPAHFIDLGPHAGLLEVFDANNDGRMDVIAHVGREKIEGNIYQLFQQGGSITKGDAGDNILLGTAKRQVFFGREGNDFIFGSDGNDVLTGGPGADQLFGGEGNDTASYRDAAVAVVADLANAAGSNKRDAAGDTYDSIENLEGSRFDDRLSGDAADNELGGGAGDDILIGRGGNDTLVGAGGDDVLKGGSGNDLLKGGVGEDILRGGGGDDKLVGGGRNDKLSGGAGNDVLKGGGGDDDLRGGGGNDKLIGGGGSDRLSGDAGDDVLKGGGGNDTLIGGAGNDIMIGGSGADRLVFAPGHGTAIIRDHEDDTDMLDLAAFGFATVAEAKSFASNVNGDVVFDFAGGEQLVVENTSLALLTANDILI